MARWPHRRQRTALSLQKHTHLDRRAFPRNDGAATAPADARDSTRRLPHRTAPHARADCADTQAAPRGHAPGHWPRCRAGGARCVALSPPGPGRGWRRGDVRPPCLRHWAPAICRQGQRAPLPRRLAFHLVLEAPWWTVPTATPSREALSRRRAPSFWVTPGPARGGAPSHAQAAGGGLIPGTSGRPSSENHAPRPVSCLGLRGPPCRPASCPPGRARASPTSGHPARCPPGWVPDAFVMPGPSAGRKLRCLGTFPRSSRAQKFRFRPGGV